jgi:hypothetical protein
MGSGLWTEGVEAVEGGGGLVRGGLRWLAVERCGAHFGLDLIRSGAGTGQGSRLSDDQMWA